MDVVVGASIEYMLALLIPQDIGGWMCWCVNVRISYCTASQIIVTPATSTFPIKFVDVIISASIEYMLALVIPPDIGGWISCCIHGWVWFCGSACQIIVSPATLSFPI